jgi:hypothetical protein
MGRQDAHLTIKSTRSTRSQALPGNADPEALPPIFLLATASEAEPLDIGSQAEPGNQLTLCGTGILSVLKNGKLLVNYYKLLGFNNPEVLLLPSDEI